MVSWLRWQRHRLMKRFFYERWRARERALGHFDSYEAWS